MLLIEKEGEFYFYFHNSFTDDSMVMKVDIHDFVSMFVSLSDAIRLFSTRTNKDKTIKIPRTSQRYYNTIMQNNVNY